MECMYLRAVFSLLASEGLHGLAYLGTWDWDRFNV